MTVGGSADAQLSQRSIDLMDRCELRRADRVSAGRAAMSAVTGVVAVRVTASE